MLYYKSYFFLLVEIILWWLFISRTVTIFLVVMAMSRCMQNAMCVWDYSATGIEYEVLAGPAFTLVFTVAALPLGLLAGFPRVNRRLAITACLALWSSMTLAASFTNQYWQLLLTRMGLGIL